MNRRKFYFLGGLPRAGSTLLCNLLAQNPRFHATHASGCMDVMFGVRNAWDNLIEHKSHPMDGALPRVLRGILYSYYEDIKRPIIVDKCRGWPSLIEMAESALGHPCKIICPVRDVRDVLSSFEKLWRKRAAKGQFAGEAQEYFQFQTVMGRCNFWLRDDQPIGIAINRLSDACRRGLRDRLHFVDYNTLTTKPGEALSGIYRFLDEPPCIDHDFDNVVQVTVENDSVYDLGVQLHQIRTKVEPQPPQWPLILGPDVANRFESLSRFWETCC